MKVARTVLNGESGSNAANLHNDRSFFPLYNAKNYTDYLTIRLPLMKGFRGFMQSASGFDDNRLKVLKKRGKNDISLKLHP